MNCFEIEEFFLWFWMTSLEWLSTGVSVLILEWELKAFFGPGEDIENFAMLNWSDLA